MKKSFLVFSLLSSSCFATVADGIITTRQFLNRNWDVQAFEVVERMHFKDYGDISKNNDSLKAIAKMKATYASHTMSDLQDFFPAHPISQTYIDNKILDSDHVSENLVFYKSWGTFLSAVSTERWEDYDPEECAAAENPLLEPSCGRKTKGDFAVLSLTNTQRISLDSLKNAIFKDLAYLSRKNGEVVPGATHVRVFQFLHDVRSIDKMLQTVFVRTIDPADENTRKVNLIDLGRALIYQSFLDKNGNLINSELQEIHLEKPSCTNLATVTQQNDCHLAYIRKLIFDPTSGEQMADSNLLLDRKGIKAFSEGLIWKFSQENSEYLSQGQMLDFIKRAYLTLCLAYDIDPLDPDISTSFKTAFLGQLELGIEYLNTRRSIIGLQMAKGLAELHAYIRGTLND